MKNVRLAFQILDENEEVPIGYKFICCHMIFDVKMEDFCRKSRLVSGGHMTDTPEAITYASFVSHESVRLALILAALNALEVKCGDVESKCLSLQSMRFNLTNITVTPSGKIILLRR